MTPITPDATDELHVWASDIQAADSGIGVFQRQLYRRLPNHGIQIQWSREPSNRTRRFVRSAIQVVPDSFDVSFVCGTPRPLMSRVPMVSVIHDLRWRHVGHLLHRSYRYVDLRRTVQGSRFLFTDSERTRHDLLDLFPQVESKIAVVYPGSGIVEDSDFVDGQGGTVLLVGRAEHKRNELLAQSFGAVRPKWADRFLCVGVSDATYETLIHAFGANSCSRFNRVSDEEMRGIYRRSDVYITASKEEGFGFPAIEALAAGCQVIAVRQPLTLETVGDAAILLEDFGPDKFGEQLKDLVWVSAAKRQVRAARYSWDETAISVSNGLRLAGQK